MKRLTTYYFLLLACSNFYFARVLSKATTFFDVFVRERFLEGQALPMLTEWVILYSWWPWIGFAVCVIGAVLSLLGIPKDNILKNLLIIVLIVEFWIMFFFVVAFILPWVKQ